MAAYETDGGTLLYDVRSQWRTGFVADMSVTAASATEVWRIEIELDAEITNIWNARIVSRDGNRYVIEGLSYNDTLAAGETASFGFQAKGSETEIDGDSVRVNGEGAGETPPPPPPIVPEVSIGDAVATEGEDQNLTFTVTLSEPTTTDLVIQYETVAGSAAGGSDFVPRTGQLTIAAGATSGTITIDLLDDNVVEASEAFVVRLLSVEGGEIEDGEAVGTILDTDVEEPNPLALSIADVSVAEGDPAETGGGSGGGSSGSGLFADGPLSTDGNQIVDSTGAAVEIRAVNWFGLETNNASPHGLWARNWQSMMDQMKELGFNAIRLPFSGELVSTGGSPNGINYSLNPDLQGLTGLEIMDAVIEYAGDIGLRVLLDHHRSYAGDGANGSGLWYGNGVSEADWISMWEVLADRYAGDDTIIGADLHNEPHGPATWGDGGATDWARAAEEAGNAILAVNSDWLIVVEGIGAYQGDNYWWGGQLGGVRDYQVQLDLDNKLVYSPHDYPASVYNQPWFNDGSDLYQVFRDAWGFIYEEGIAPILVGELGSRLATAKDRAWADAITTYLGGDFNGDGVNDLASGEARLSFAWWSWNPNSGDTGGILNDDWTTVRSNAIDLLEPFLEAPEGGGQEPTDPAPEPDPNFAVFTVALDQAAGDTVILDYATSDGTATAGDDYVATSGQLVFEAGEQQKTVSVEIIADNDVEDDEDFILTLTDSDGGSWQAKATITDDDSTDDGDDGDDGGDGDGPTDPPVEPPVDDGELLASFSVRNDWGGGATVDLVLTNESGEQISGWEVAFDLPTEIRNLWGGVLETDPEGRYVVENLSWNGRIDPGSSATVGFNTVEGGLDVALLNAGADFDIVIG